MRHRGTRVTQSDEGCPKGWAASKAPSVVDAFGTRSNFDLVAVDRLGHTLAVEVKWLRLSGGKGPNGEFQRFIGQCALATGDDWEHVLEFEELVPAEGGAYPRCLAGAGACPPEDVGGTHGYKAFLQVIRDARHPERESMLQWAGGWAGGSFDPDAFAPASVTFDDPRERWKIAFEHRSRAV
jgi:hypothetical protein